MSQFGFVARLVVAIVLLTVAVGFFLFGIALAVASINFAQIDDERYVRALNSTSDYFEDYWYLYMGGASLAMLPFCIFGCLGLVLLISSIRHTTEHGKRSRSQGDDVDGLNEIHEGSITGRIDMIKGVPIVQFDGASLAPVTIGATISVFVAMLLSSLALLCILWGLAISYNNVRRVDKDVWPYIVVEALIGLVMPILIVIAASIFAIFLEYITQGSIDARVLITRLLPVVKLVRGEKYEYWSITDRFYFQLSSHDSNFRSNSKPKSCAAMCSRTPATWIITAIVALSFLLSVSYFINSNIAQQFTLQSCPHISAEVDCFNRTFHYVDCQDNSFDNTTTLHCFRFLRFGVDSDVIGDLSRAFAFYLATLAFFTTAFQIANVLINFKPSRLWGILFIGLGIIMVIVAIIITFNGGALQLQLDVIQVFQIYMVAGHIMLTGLLLLISKWWEKVGNSKSLALISPGFLSGKKDFNDVEKKLNDDPKSKTTNV